MSGRLSSKNPRLLKQCSGMGQRYSPVSASEAFPCNSPLALLTSTVLTVPLMSTGSRNSKHCSVKPELVEVSARLGSRYVWKHRKGSSRPKKFGF